MAKLLWAVTCQSTITDKDTNLLSMINVVNGLTTHKLPRDLPPLCLATLWERGGDRPEDLVAIRLCLHRPSGKEYQLIETSDITFTTDFHRVNFNLSGLFVEEPGRHEIRVKLKSGNQWRVQAALPLMITLQATDANDVSKDD